MEKNDPKAIKILAIEDNALDSKLIKELLGNSQSELFDLTISESLDNGLTNIEKNKYDAVLLDLNLPDSTGFDTLLTIKQRYPLMPIIVITGESEENIGQDAVHHGAQDFISKEKINRDTLIKSIRYAIERKLQESSLYDAFIELKKIQDMLIQTAKLNAIGQLASGVGHEVRNPLGIILQCINYLDKKYTKKSKDVKETMSLMKRNIQRADKIVSVLLDFSKASKLELEPSNLNELIDSSLHLVEARCEFKKIKIIKEYQKDIPIIKLDKTRMEQVFINIVLNGIQAMPRGGTITLRTLTSVFKGHSNLGRRSTDSLKIGGKVLIAEVIDTGKGIPHEDLSKIFAPFFTTKSSSKGNGLGLLVCQNIVNMHRGIIEVDSTVNKGTKMTIILPIS